MSAAGPVAEASVLVPVLDEEAHVAEALAAMRAQRGVEGLEILVIDGGSRDRTRSVVEAITGEDPRVWLLENPHRRTPAALNIGLRRATGEYIVRMDAHTIYPDDYIARGIARLRRGDVAWVSGAQHPHGVGRWSRRTAIALGTRLGTGGAAFRHQAGAEIETESGFTGVWRRTTLEEHGGWDEGWPVNQDAELAARIRRAGGRIVCLPEMTARYIPRDSLRALARQYWRYGLYRAKTSRRHPESLRRAHLLPPALTLALVASLAPWPLVARPARAALAAYGLASLGSSAWLARSGELRDAVAVPAVLATMHLSWGVGFLGGLLRFGPPVAAVPRLFGFPRSPGPAASPS